MKRYKKINEAGTGNYAPSNFLFYTIEDYTKAVDLLEANKVTYRTGVANYPTKKFVDEYIAMTYMENAKKAIKVFDKNKIKYYWAT